MMVELVMENPSGQSCSIGIQLNGITVADDVEPGDLPQLVLETPMLVTHVKIEIKEDE